jgi:solute carrier family 35, member F5
LSPSYGLGLLFIVLVTLIWSVASMVVQFLYTDANFGSPFLLTYIGSTLFVLFLPSRMIWERRRRLCSLASSNSDDEGDVIPWETQDTYEQIPTSSLPDEGLSVQPAMQTKTVLLSHRQHFDIAMKIAPVWFISNFAYNASLKYTSITSSTVLASTGSLFTFLFAIVSKDEKFTLLKLLGVLFGFMGSALTGWSDIGQSSDNVPGSNSTFVDAGPAASSNPHQDRALFGDFLGLLSAVGYGTYTVMIRVLCPHEEETYSMQLLLGYIGLVNGLLLLPITIYLMFISQSSTTIHNLTLVVFGYLVAKGMLDNVLSDYLWARAVILTSATVATVGLGLTIPLAFFSDWFMGNAGVVNTQSICGAVSVLIGFTLVNIGFSNEETTELSGIEIEDSVPIPTNLMAMNETVTSSINE